MPHKYIKKKNFLLLCGLLLFFTACTLDTQDSQGSYLIVEELGGESTPLIRLYQADLASNDLQLLIEFDAQNEYWLSPNGQYLALLHLHNDNDLRERNLEIIQLDNKETIGQISEVGYLYPNNFHVHIGPNSVLWSPSNDKILFERNSVDDEGNVLWVYDLETNSEVQLTSGKRLERNPAWSNNSQDISFVSTECVQNSNTCNQLDAVWDIFTVNIQNQSTQLLADFPNKFTSFEPGTGDGFFCNLLWSPDNQFIAFENECLNSGSILENHRVFNINVENGMIEEALKFEQPFAYRFSYDWLDEDNLLISYSKADYLNLQSFIKGGIKSFEPHKGIQSENVELLGFRGNELQLSPNNTKFIVFTKEPFFDSSEVGQLFTSGSTLLGNYIKGDMTISSESNLLPNGLCSKNTAIWSPDGRYVAYSSIGKQHACIEDKNATNVYVYSTENKQSVNLTDSLKGVVTPVGWLTIQN